MGGLCQLQQAPRLGYVILVGSEHRNMLKWLHNTNRNYCFIREKLNDLNTPFYEHFNNARIYLFTFPPRGMFFRLRGATAYVKFA